MRKFLCNLPIAKRFFRWLLRYRAYEDYRDVYADVSPQQLRDSGITFKGLPIVWVDRLED